ncbi:MAG TPA: hypothetical protein VG842_10785 [Sediminibacterium sp.]|nr:hypothetical protein [Sediminibacterium sp.]
MVGFGFSRCASTRSAAALVMNNEATTAVPITVTITEAASSRKIDEKQLTLVPGLQQYSLGKIQKGNYLVSVQMGNGPAAATQNLSLDTDRWIIIGYTEGDSSFIMRRYGYVDSGLQKNSQGLYQMLNLYTESRKPPYLLTPR